MKTTTRSLVSAPLCLLVELLLLMVRLLLFSFDAQPACGSIKISSVTVWLVCNLNLSVIRLCLFCYLCVINFYPVRQFKVYFCLHLTDSCLSFSVVSLSCLVTMHIFPLSFSCLVTMHRSPLLHVLFCLDTGWPSTAAIFPPIHNE